ncbi:RNA-binding protein, putative [Trypanosoma brucei brucei TREU927]|uniref:RNA-binding protein, putative n=1 Tax=Trypanosoma brucei brucei (strain 927/4 GUTat10.1) TaxID=185431 RepID=Q389L2_TRYB2|nr:uncharacterized protein Tb10.26.0740 [Trypanosoma brucei brucei TREU927]EAN78508.1 RNA-binding protein, putative [Trypanosoma brucei brucei TREU927]
MVDPSVLLAYCPTHDFQRIEAVVREWPGVEAVGSLRTKEGKENTTSVFIKFSDKEAARDATSRIDAVPGLVRKIEEPKAKQRMRKMGKNMLIDPAMEIFSFGATDKGDVTFNERKREGNRRRHPSVIGPGSGSERTSNKGNNAIRHHPFTPPARASVALVDNVPFNMTNDQVARLFSPFGELIDLSRYETMAMVFYRSPDSVLKCIQQLNGKTVKGKIITVSSGAITIPGLLAAVVGVQVHN